MALYSILSLLLVIFLFYLYIGLGTTVQKLFKLENRESYLSALLIPFAFGYGIIGNILTLFGYLQIISIYSVIFLLLSTLLVLLFSLKEINELNNQIIKDLLSFKDNLKQNKLVSILILVMICGYFVRSLLPPTGFDGLMYHLSTVKLYLQKGGFWDIYFNPQSDFPMLTEMHFMIGLALKNDILTKGISFLLFIMTLVLISELSKKISGKGKDQLFAILVFSTLTVVIANVPNCDVDIAQALWAGISILLVLEYVKNKNSKYVYVASFIAGLSVQSKIFGIFIIPILFVFLLMIHRKDFWKYKRQFISITIIPLIMGMLWYIKSIVYSGSIFSGNVSGKIDIANDINIILLGGQFFKSLILSPWHYSLFPSLHRNDTIGPIFLMVLPFLFFIKKNRNVNLLLTLSLVYLLQIAFMDVFILKHGSSIRYIIIVLILLCPVVAYVINNLPDNFYKKIILIYVLFSITINALMFLKRYNKDWIAFLTQKSREEYLLSVLPQYEIIKEINSLDDEMKVMPIYNFSEYLIEKDYVTAHKKYKERDEILKDIKKFNIGYIFANNVLDTLENKEPFPYLEKELLYNANGFYLFKLKDDLFE